MNKRYLLLTLTLVLIFLGICLIFAQQIVNPEGLYVDETRNTNGTLTFTVRTVSYSGAYAPRNAGAIWITNSSNQFVKTIKVWAQTYRYTLVKWLTSSGNNTTGAITSASLNSHQLHTVTWNGSNALNAAVADGNYNINIEFTEHNASSSNPGKYKSITFAKGTSALDQTPANETYFTNMHLTWAPIIANGTISGMVRDSAANPIAGAVIMVGALNSISSSTGLYSLSVPPGTYNVTCEAPDYQAQTRNDVIVQSGLTSTVDFSLSSTSDNDPTEISASLVLQQNYPNPFRNSTTISYDLSKAGKIDLAVYDIRGRLVKTLVNQVQSGGKHEIIWNGKSSSGVSVSSGKYICRLNYNGTVKTRIIEKLQ